MLRTFQRVFNQGAPTIAARQTTPDIQATVARSWGRHLLAQERQNQAAVAAKEMLLGSHQRIFQSHGAYLGGIDIYKDGDLTAAEDHQRAAKRAWRLIVTHAHNTYGSPSTLQALRELGLNGS